MKYNEEIFGPVVVIIKFKTNDEAIEIANDSIYGLAGGVYTQNLDIALKVTNEIKTDTMWVSYFDVFDQSTPFGGYKQSGFGKELGKYALQEYTQDHSSCMVCTSKLIFFDTEYNHNAISKGEIRTIDGYLRGETVKIFVQRAEDYVDEEEGPDEEEEEKESDDDEEQEEPDDDEEQEEPDEDNEDE
ncbi:Aldedh-domain-containing protein [Lichtheimia hyalospora FSU 10163]|nr:Aldedh-domain-containing protein [Lichtheimia hyalospora FSU 10163]